MTDHQKIKQLNRRHVMRSWSANKFLDPLVIKDVEEICLIDENDKRILDFSVQMKAVNVGYKNPNIINAIQERAGQVCYISSVFAYKSPFKMVGDLAEITPGDLDKFFSLSPVLEYNDLN